MKKRLYTGLLVLVLALAMIVTGCGPKTPADDEGSVNGTEISRVTDGLTEYLFDGEWYTSEELWAETGAKYDEAEAEDVQLDYSTTRLVSETETSAIIEVDYNGCESTATFIMLKSDGEWIVDIASF